MGLCGIQTLKIICMSYLGQVFDSLTSKGLKISGVSGFLFWAIEPIRKDGNGGKFEKPHFRGKLMI